MERFWLGIILVAVGAGVAAVAYAFDTIGLAALLGVILLTAVAVWAVTLRRAEVLWVVYAASMASLPLPWGRVEIGDLLVPPPALVALLAMVLIAIRTMRERWWVVVPSRAYAWLALAFLGFAISVPGARFVELALGQFAKWTFHAGLVVLLGSMIERRWHLRTVQALGLATGALAAYGLAAYMWGDRYDVNFYEGIGTRSASGMHLAIILPLLIGLLSVRELGAFHRGLLAAATVVSVLALAFTYVRAGWVAVMAALLVMAILGRRGAPLMGLLSVGLALVLWLPETVQARFESIFTFGGWGEHSSISNSMRIELMRRALDLIAENPLVGVGLSNYPMSIPWYMYGGSVYGAVPHNIYLLVWAEGGLLALVGLLGFLWTVGARLVRATRAAAAPSSRAMLIGLLGSWTAVVTFMMFGDDFNHLLVWTALGLGISGARVWGDVRATVAADPEVGRVERVASGLAAVRRS